MVQVFIKKTSTNLNSNAIFSCSFHFVLIHFTVAFFRFLINGGYKFGGLLPVRFAAAWHEGPENQTKEHQFETDRSAFPVFAALWASVKHRKENHTTESCSWRLAVYSSAIEQYCASKVFPHCSRIAVEGSPLLDIFFLWYSWSKGYVLRKTRRNEMSMYLFVHKHVWNVWLTIEYQMNSPWCESSSKFVWKQVQPAGNAFKSYWHSSRAKLERVWWDLGH